MSRYCPCKRGFTLIEVMIVGMMMVLLAIVLSSAWSGLGQPSIDTLVRCQVQQEAQLAAMSLAADCGGCPPVSNAAIEGLQGADIFTGASITDDQLQISFSSGTTILYSFDEDAHTLVRQTTGSSASSVVIASNVYGMTLEDEGSFIEVTLTFQFRDIGPDKYRDPYQYIFYVPTVIP